MHLPVIYEVRSLHEATWGGRSADGASPYRTHLREAKENWCMTQADAVVVLGEEMQDLVIERGISPRKVHIVPNCVDESIMELDTNSVDSAGVRLQLGVGPDETLLGYISNFSKREGQEFLVRTFKSALVQHPDWKLVLVGQGPEWNRVRALVGELGISAQVSLVGSVDRHEVAAWFRALDIFVVPRISDYAGDLVTPLKPFEAMALSVPVVASGLPAAKEILGFDCERGWLFEPGSSQGLIEALENVVQDPDTRIRKVALARSWVRENRSLKVMGEQYTQLYEEIMPDRTWQAL